MLTVCPEGWYSVNVVFPSPQSNKYLIWSPSGSILDDASKLGSEEFIYLFRLGCKMRFYDAIEPFFTDEVLKYVQVWIRQQKII